MEYYNNINLKQIFSRFPTLTTERLTLRRMYISDASDMFEYSKRDDVTEYLLWNAHNSLEYTLKYLHYLQKEYRKGNVFDWAVVIKDTNKMIGTCGFTQIDLDNGMGEIGYVINPDFQNKGYATEAVKEILKFGFQKLNLNRIQAKYIVGNDISRHIMEKCGMQYEGTARNLMYVKGEFKDIGICAILRRDTKF